MSNAAWRVADQFEHDERERFGEDGFEKMVDRVARLERMVGVNDLDQFTPPRDRVAWRLRFQSDRRCDLLRFIAARRTMSEPRVPTATRPALVNGCPFDGACRASAGSDHPDGGAAIP